MLPQHSLHGFELVDEPNLRVRVTRAQASRSEALGVAKLGRFARVLQFDLVDEFLGQLDAADGDAYSSIFVPTGGGTTPEFWLARSKKEATAARATLARFLEL